MAMGWLKKFTLIWIGGGMCLLTPPLYALNLYKYARSAQSHRADESARTTLLGIIGSCGGATNMDDNCVVQNLERVSTEENNHDAYIMLRDYEQATNEGHYDDQPECQNENHRQVNRTIGHCTLLLNYYALETNDIDSSRLHYEMCLQGGMLGLAYQGNLAAQYALSLIFAEKDLSEHADLWRNAIKARKNTEAYKLLMKCYR